MREVHLLGVGATSFSRQGRTADQLIRQAVTAALADAGLKPRDIRAFTLATGSHRVEQGGLTALDDGAAVPFPPVCTLGAAALNLGWRAVATGAHDIVICVGHELTNSVVNGQDPARLQSLAASAARYMEASGATESHFARVAVNNRAHGAVNPRALLTTPVNSASVLASDVLVWPLHGLMVAQRSEGAAAVVLASSDRGRRTGARAPRMRASILLRDGDTGATAGAARVARLGYEAAGLGPEDIDCAETDHPTAAGELPAYEALQFAPDGQGPELVESGFTALGGVLPVNTSGGALSQGDAAGAAGIAQLCELTWQLRGEAGRRQAAGARVGLALSSGVEGERAVVSLTILTTG